MMVEGRGAVAPSPVIVRLTPGEVASAVEAARKRDGFQRYGESDDAWRRGMVRGAVLFGMLGEHALARWCNTYAGCSITVDTELRRGGDGGRDFIVEGLHLDAKARATSNRNLIRRDKHQRLVCHAYVFCVVGPSEEIRARDVSLLGWIRHKDVPMRARLEPGRAGHTNYRILDRDLEPMSRLVEQIQFRRDWRKT